jgi:hypothetical protein
MRRGERHRKARPATPLTPPQVLELMHDRKPDLSFPHIAEAWAENLLSPHGTAG